MSPAAKDLAKLLLATAAFLLSYNIVIDVVQPRVGLYDFEAGRHNTIIADRYLFGKEPWTAVLVGSSMSRRLGFGDDCRLGNDFYNLALDGDGPLTGLALIEAKKEKPRVVLVETNWIRRPLDTELLEQAAGIPERYFRAMIPAVREEFTPATLAQAAYAGHFRTPEPTSFPAPPAVPDGEPDSMPKSLAYTLQHWGAVTPEIQSSIDAGIDLLKVQIARLQAAGTRVVLVFLPMHPELAASPSFRMTLDALQRSFPGDRYEWLDLVDRPSYYTVDSIHLTAVNAQRLTFVARKALSLPPLSGKAAAESTLLSTGRM